MSIIAQRTQSFNIQNPARLTIPGDQEEYRDSPGHKQRSSAKPRGHHRQGAALKDTGQEVWARGPKCLLSLCPPVNLNWLRTIPLLPSLAAVVQRASSITEAPSTTVALVMKVSEGVSGSDIAWPGPGAAVSIPTSGWSGQDCHGAATAAGTAIV